MVREQREGVCNKEPVDVGDAVIVMQWGSLREEDRSPVREDEEDCHG